MTAGVFFNFGKWRGTLVDCFYMHWQLVHLSALTGVWDQDCTGDSQPFERGCFQRRNEWKWGSYKYPPCPGKLNSFNFWGHLLVIFSNRSSTIDFLNQNCKVTPKDLWSMALPCVVFVCRRSGLPSSFLVLFSSQVSLCCRHFSGFTGVSENRRE